MENLPALAGPSGTNKRKLSCDDTPLEVKKAFNLKCRVKLIQGTYIGDMKKAWVVSLPPCEWEEYVTKSVLDSYGSTLKTGSLPVFYKVNPGFVDACERERHIQILDKIEVCFAQRKKDEGAVSNPEEEIVSSAPAKKEGTTVIQLLKKINDTSEFLIDMKEPTVDSSVEVFACGFLDEPTGLRQKWTSVVLPDDVAIGKIVAVFFSCPVIDKWLSDNEAEKRKKCDMQIDFKLIRRGRSRGISIDSKWIKYGDGVVYQREDMAWKLLYHYRNKSIGIHLQTLVYQGPLIVDEHAKVITIDRGERILSEQLIKEFYQHQCDMDQALSMAATDPIEPLVWAWCTKDSLTDFLQRSVNNRQKHFFYHLESHMHTVAVFMYKNKGYWSCYIHESLGTTNSVALQIREDVKNILESFYSNSLIYILYPSLKLQYDYESCGVIALKAMELMRTKKEGLINDLNAVIGKRKSMQKQSKCVIQKEVKVNQLPIEFLKYYQGNLARIPAWKLNWRLKGEQTLRDYLNKYSVTLTYPNSDETLTTRLVGYCKRLKIMRSFHALKTGVKMQQALSEKEESKESISKPHYTLEQKKGALNLRKQGKTWNEIKTQTGVPANVVKRYENKLKIQEELVSQQASGQAVASEQSAAAVVD